MTTFSLVDSSNGKFTIVGNTVRVAAPLDYETASSHTITIAAFGVTPRAANQTVTILVDDVTEPTINLSSTSVLESATIGATVGTLSVSSATGTPIYTLVDNAGGKFSISGSMLLVAGVLNYETASSHTVLISAIGTIPIPDARPFIIAVVNVAKSIVLSNNTIPEDIEAGTTIGELSVIEGTGTYTFTIVADPDNIFTLDGEDIGQVGTIDYETATSHLVTIRADNGAGDVFDQTLTIFVTDVADTTPPVTYPAGTIGRAVFGRGVYINPTATRQYITAAGLYINEVV